MSVKQGTICFGLFLRSIWKIVGVEAFGRLDVLARFEGRCFKDLYYAVEFTDCLRSKVLATCNKRPAFREAGCRHLQALALLNSALVRVILEA